MVSFLGVPPPTVIAGLVYAVLLGSVTSLAVIVLLPTVLSVRLSGVAIGRGKTDGVGNGINHVPIGVHGIDRHVKGSARRLRAGCTGLTAGRAGCGGFAGHQQLGFAEEAGADAEACADRVGHAAGGGGELFAGAHGVNFEIGEGGRAVAGPTVMGLEVTLTRLVAVN